MTCGYPTQAGGRCRQPGRPCKYHGPGKEMSRLGNEAQRCARAEKVYVNLSTRRTVEKTLQSVARAVADYLLSDKRGNVLARLAAEKIKILDLRLEEREELVREAEAGA